MLQETAYIDHPVVREVVFSTHAVARFRSRAPWRSAGSAEVMAALIAVVQHADVSRIAPGWVASDRDTTWWVLSGDLAFPLAEAGAGRWVAVTCLRR